LFNCKLQISGPQGCQRRKKQALVVDGWSHKLENGPISKRAASAQRDLVSDHQQLYEGECLECQRGVDPTDVLELWFLPCRRLLLSDGFKDIARLIV
jgi:hypothetical protein